MHLDFKKYIKPAFIEGKVGSTAQKSAQSILYNDLRPHIVRLLKNKGVLNTEDAEDIFHQAIFALYKNVQKEEFQLTTSLQNYVWAIARNLFYKKNASKKWTEAVPNNEKEVFNIKQAEDWNEDKFIEEINPIIRSLDVWSIVESTLEELDEVCKKLIKLRNKGKKFREIFDLMPELKSADNAKHKTNRCKKALIKKVKSHPHYETSKNKYYDMENENLHDLLLKYVEGELKGEELASFELELKTNEELQEDLEILQVMQSNSEDKGLEILNENLNEFFTEIQDSKSKQNIAQKKITTQNSASERVVSKTRTIAIYKRNWFRVAATLLLFPLLSLLVLNHQIQPEKLAVNNFQEFKISNAKGTHTAKSDSDVEGLMKEGSDLFKKNEPSEAIKNFDKLLDIKDVNERIKSKAQFNKALCYLKMDDYTRCRQELQIIIDDKDEKYHKNDKSKASSLLWKVKILERKEWLKSFFITP